jgi:hypothetical protein
MAELESIRMADSATKYLDFVRRRVDNLIIEDIGPAILAIDTGEFDNVTLRNGVWVPYEKSDVEMAE